MIRRLADRLADAAVADLDARGKATVVGLAVLDAAGLLYRLADWRSA